MIQCNQYIYIYDEKYIYIYTQTSWIIDARVSRYQRENEKMPQKKIIIKSCRRRGKGIACACALFIPIQVHNHKKTQLIISSRAVVAHSARVRKKALVLERAPRTLKTHTLSHTREPGIASNGRGFSQLIIIPHNYTYYTDEHTQMFYTKYTLRICKAN